jgi:lipopolysaccharide biosynthesis regulator YciM
MEFDISWILLGLPLAFVLGWLASRFDLRQLRAENRRAPKAYFKGLNFLLNEQQDQAIDAFIEAVQNDPDTSELHFALGNLFRRRANTTVRCGTMPRRPVPCQERAQPGARFSESGLLDRAKQPKPAGRHTV